MLVNRIGAGFCCTNTLRPDAHEKNCIFSRLNRRWVSHPLTARPTAFHGVDSAGKEQSICTADEVHYVPVSGSNWNLALWRYLPSPKVKALNTTDSSCSFCDFSSNHLSCSDPFSWTSLDFIAFTQTGYNLR